MRRATTLNREREREENQTALKPLRGKAGATCASPGNAYGSLLPVRNATSTTAMGACSGHLTFSRWMLCSDLTGFVRNAAESATAPAAERMKI